MRTDLVHAASAQGHLDEAEGLGRGPVQVADAAEVRPGALAPRARRAPPRAPLARDPQRRVQGARPPRRPPQADADVQLPHPAGRELQPQPLVAPVALRAEQRTRGLAVEAVHEPVLGAFVPSDRTCRSKPGDEPLVQRPRPGARPPVLLLRGLIEEADRGGPPRGLPQDARVLPVAEDTRRLRRAPVRRRWARCGLGAPPRQAAGVQRVGVLQQAARSGGKETLPRGLHARKVGKGQGVDQPEDPRSAQGRAAGGSRALLLLLSCGLARQQGSRSRSYRLK
mmetsp:Transcript_59694/g.187147  ORF Transcript_59694/g.187147 Transcript_59694/m.187147 type:complete len:282 (-) Transcript_59694:13-858(-)